MPNAKAFQSDLAETPAQAASQKHAPFHRQTTATFLKCQGATDGETQDGYGVTQSLSRTCSQ